MTNVLIKCQAEDCECDDFQFVKGHRDQEVEVLVVECIDCGTQNEMNIHHD